MIKFDVQDPADVLSTLDRIDESLHRKVYASGGKALEIRLRKFYREKNQKPNKQGWWKSNFYNREGAQKTALAEVTRGKATVTIASQPIAFKYTGGRITPKRTKNLALPLSSGAKESGSPREGGIENLFFIKTRSGKRFLARREMNRTVFYYLLLQFTDHDPDPTVIPKESDMKKVVLRSMSRTIDRIMKGLRNE